MYIYMCGCACVRACACVCMYLGYARRLLRLRLRLFAPLRLGLFTPNHLGCAQGGEGGIRGMRLHVEYVERGLEYGSRFIFSLFCEYVHLEYVRIHLIYRVNQAEYVIRILVVAPQEYVNIY